MYRHENNCFFFTNMVRAKENLPNQKRIKLAKRKKKNSQKVLNCQKIHILAEQQKFIEILLIYLYLFPSPSDYVL